MSSIRGHHVRIALFCAAILTALCALLVLHVVDDYRLTVGQARERARLTAHHVAQDLERRLYGIEQMFLGIDDLLTLTHGDDTAKDLVEAVLHARQRREADFMDLLVVDARGRIRCWTGSGTPPSVTDRGYVTTHLQHGDSVWFIGPPQWSKVHRGRRFFAVSRAFRTADGRLRHILVAILDLASVAHAYADLPTPGTQLALHDSQGHTYFTLTGHSPPIPVWKRTSTWFGNRTPIIAGAAVAGTPLQIRVSQKTNPILAPWLTDLFLSLALGCLIAAAMMGAFRRFSRQQARLDFLATTDALSRLSNRGHFMALAGKLFTQSRRYDQPLSALVIDIDDFKQVNDRFGHGEGDRAIRAVADLLRRHCRTSDLVGRVGGEEFVMLLPNTPVTGALATAEKILKGVEAIRLGDRSSVSVTVSIGVSGRGAGDTELATLINRADQALYRAKQAGKNRVEQLRTRFSLP